MILIDQTSQDEPTKERRSHPRLHVQRPAKIFDPGSGKYHIGSTRDLSAGGMLIELSQGISARPGDSIMIGVAQTRRQPILRQSEMLRATVVRAMQSEANRMMIAVQLPPSASVQAPHIRRAA